MAKYSYWSIIAHTTDNDFRAWGSQLSAGLSSAGLTQTADTGQINWTSVTIPGISTPAGYEIWRNADSTLFLKLEYGTGSTTTRPHLWQTIGTGSDGVGNLTGQLTTRSLMSLDANLSGNSGPTFLSSSVDHISIAWGGNASASTGVYSVLQVHKTVDGITGLATSEGFCRLANALGSSSNYKMQSVRLVETAKTYNDTTYWGLVPGSPSASDPPHICQVWLPWMNIPEMRPSVGTLIYVGFEIAKYSTFNVKPIGSQSRGYVTLGPHAVAYSAAFSSNIYYIALRYD